MQALDQILKNSCGLNANHPQFVPPPLGLVKALDNQRAMILEKMKAEGKELPSTLYDLSGNKIIIEDSK
jgi:hypothetical protein